MLIFQRLCMFLMQISMCLSAFPSMSNPSYPFLEAIEKISQAFSTCSIFYFTGDLETRRQIDHFSYTSTTSTKTKLQLNPSVNHNLELQLNTTNINLIESYQNVIKFKNILQIRRISDQCTLIFCWNLDGESFTSFRQILSGKVPIFMKDVHFFTFFYSDPLITSRASRKIPEFDKTLSRIKYKVIITQNIQDSTMKITTICFYCNKGAPSTLRLNIEDLTRRDILLRDFVSQGFFGRKLKISYPESTTFLLETKLNARENRLLIYRGIYALFISASMEKLNFTYEIFPSTGGGTGLILPNKTWIGTVADVMYGKADIGLSTAEILARHERVAFSFPVTYEYLTFTYGESQRIYKLHVLLWPLDPPIWYTVIAGLFLLSIVFHFSLKLFHNLENERKYWTLGEILTCFLATSTEQSIKMPKHISLKVLIGSWLLLIIIVSTAYKSKLITHLLFPVTKSPPKTFFELSNSKDYTWGLQFLGGAAFHLFKTATSSTYMKIYSQMELEPIAVQCFNRSVIEQFCCIAWVRIFDYISSKNLSDRYGQNPIFLADEKVFFLGQGLVMEKRAIFKSNFDKIIHSSVDTGLSLKWETLDHEFVRNQRLKWEKETNFINPFTNAEKKAREIALSLKHFYGPFVMYLMASLIGITLFAYEILWSFNNKKKILRIVKSVTSIPHYNLSYKSTNF